MSVSCTEPLSAWPMCSAPVTFGGGPAIEKFSSAVPSGSGEKIPLSSPPAITRGWTSAGSKRVRDSSSDTSVRVYARLSRADHHFLLHRHRVQVAEELVGPGRREAVRLLRAVLEGRGADDARAAGEEDVVAEGIV